MNAHDDNATDWITDDDATDSVQEAPPEAPWTVLIVDDDVDVHVVTKFSLSNACFQGRRLNFLHAYSGEEALTILRSTPHVALVLLDVIMETSDAGLRVARQIREQLGNSLVRIVLRTGQPGQALEHSIILDYDINDFWCKSDLTTRKLFTTVIASLRGYASLALNGQKMAALEAELAQQQGRLATLEKHGLAATVDAQGKLLSVSEQFCTLLGRARADLLERELPLAPGMTLADALAALAGKPEWDGALTLLRDDGTPLPLQVSITAAGNPGSASYFIAASKPRAE